MKCYDCEEVFENESSKGILEQMYPHYMKEHAEIITNASEEEKSAWMEKFNADFDAAPEM